MKKKIILLIGLLFLLCGCSSEATVNFTKDGINEEIVTTYTDSSISKSFIKQAFRDYFPVYKSDELFDEEPDVKKDGVSYYNKTLTEIDNGYIAKYQFNFLSRNYKKAKSLDTAFTSYNIIEDSKNGTFTFSTANNSFKLFAIYPDLTSFKVNIKSDYQVVSANVEPVDGVYTWTFTPDDYDDNIYIVFNTKVNSDGSSNTESTSETSGDNKTKENKVSNHLAIIYAICGIGIFFVGLIFISKMEKKR